MNTNKIRKDATYEVLEGKRLPIIAAYKDYKGFYYVVTREGGSSSLNWMVSKQQYIDACNGIDISIKYK